MPWVLYGRLVAGFVGVAVALFSGRDTVAARRCTRCSIDWETGPGRLNCPDCGDALIFSSVRKGTTPWPGVPRLDPLTDEVRDLMLAGWARVKAEAYRRGPRWSYADIIESYPRDETAA